MGKKLLFGSVIGLSLLGLLMSCTLSGMSDVEFARALTEESADATNLYPEQSKTVPADDGLVILIQSTGEDPTGVYNYEVTFSFSNYTPPFAPDSIVEGELTGTVAFDAVQEVVTVVFEGHLTVQGEHAGDYYFDSTLVIYLATGEYEYDGSVKIGDTVHDVSK
jgi:hypothetical protein